MDEFDIDFIEFLTEFCLNEIALEGLQGCELIKLFDLLYESTLVLTEYSNNDSSNKYSSLNRFFTQCKSNEAFKNFLIRILLNQHDIKFYSTENLDSTNNNSKLKKSNIRSLVLAKTKNSKYQKIINDPELKQRGHCSNYFERKLISHQDSMTYNQLISQYKNILIVASQQLRNRVLCPSYKDLDFENVNDLEYCVLELIGRGRYEGIHSTGDNGLVQQFDLAPKQLHYILVNLESHGLIKKQVLTSEKKKSVIQLTKFSCKIKTITEKLCDYLIKRKDKDSAHPYSDSAINLKKVLNISNKQFKTLIQSTEKQGILKRFLISVEGKFKKNKTSNKTYLKNRQVRMIRLTEACIKQYLSNQDENVLEEEEDEGNVEIASVDSLGTAQSRDLSLYTQIFNKIDECGKEGISLKQIGNMFGFDFYKSRRMGGNLQTHPDIVTMIKETNRGKAKYQTIFLRKYLTDTKKQASNELTILPQKNIQALVSNRMLNRKNIILDYLEKNKICTKYELTREIREQEEKLGLKGAIDAKTTKRMLMALEKEAKLKIFDVNLKSTSYMGVRIISLSEDDELFKNYCATFRRTFDSVDLKPKKQINLPDPSNQNSFRLTKKFIQSTVSGLQFSPVLSRKYAIVPKFQKAIILHRFLSYILFYYNGVQQSTQADPLPNLPQDEIDNFNELNKSDLKIVDSCQLPTMDRVYQPLKENNHVVWNSFIPGIQRTNDKECIFIGEIFSQMPVSIFCSIIVINHQVPGLVAILKHAQKRHLLVKDLPAELIAPLIFERRYLQRILANLQLLACLGLVTFVESQFKNNQALNRDVQSQMIYVHRKAMFYDTSSNKCTDWPSLKELNLSSNIEYEKCFFEFNSDQDVIDYWRKLVHVSMNTFKFSVAKNLHESKQLRQELLNKIVNKIFLSEVKELWPIENYGDHMGPGLYDSQLFLNSFKNWMINQSTLKNDSNKNTAITKDADQSFAPYCELALFFPFGVFRGLASNSTTTPRQPKKPKKRKLQEKPKKSEFKFKRIKLVSKPRNQNLIKTAKYLVDKAKFQSHKVNNNSSIPDHRATWTRAEDEMILLIKVAGLYFYPNEKSVPFKLINDIMNQLMPRYCKDKRVSSFGRRIKILMKSKMNCLNVTNKLELCKFDRELEMKYSNRKSRVKKYVVDKEMVDMYIDFVKDLKNKFMNDEINKNIELSLPETIDEFNNKYKILNTQKDLLLKTPLSFYQQPKTDYEITFNTLHSAIHSSILINDKNPRVFEAFNLFDKYSDQLLTDVINKMSSQHKIIAPTKYAELKKKNVTAFSKHLGKAFHISQRYQYKWINSISTSVLTETNQFKNDFVQAKLEEKSSDGMFDCTDRDDLGMTSFLAHTIDNSDIQVQIDVPNKIWVSKLI
ncbi:unnamed protein product [Brachionus calyciflorus]|uniref:B-block binding subunit of TFIIIC domain-containing protein n=1 Tax=Brachionus calyciflorus TaxID=104777 RepID=A0A813PYP3_9BILA|nr:unnamed protein product [Brachionus calyciflorus]